MSTAITRAPRPFATRIPAPPIGPIPNMATVSSPTRRALGVELRAHHVGHHRAGLETDLVWEGEAVPGWHDDVVGIAAIDVEANTLPYGQRKIAAAARLAVAAADAQIDRDTVRSDGGDTITDRDDLSCGSCPGTIWPVAVASPPTIGFP